MSAPVVRPATAADAAGLVRLSASLAGDATPCSLWGLDANAAEGLIAAGVTRVATVDGALAGVGVLAPGTGFQAHLGVLTVATDPRHRRRGVGCALLLDLVAAATDLRLTRLKALIDTRNAASQALFAACGFEHRATLYGEFRSDVFGEIDDCVFYRVLAPASHPEP